MTNPSSSSGLMTIKEANGLARAVFSYGVLRTVAIGACFCIEGDPLASKPSRPALSRIDLKHQMFSHTQTLNGILAPDDYHYHATRIKHHSHLIPASGRGYHDIVSQIDSFC